VLTLEFSALLLGKVGEVARVHFDSFFDGRVLFEVLRWEMIYLG
jgi:hypothetical protein